MASGRLLLLLFGALVLLIHQTQAQLSQYYYTHTCPGLEYTVRRVVGQAVAAEPRMGASLLRLHFHDCFVTGCDGSILLDDVPPFLGEKTAFANRRSARGFEVIDEVKTEVEKICPGVVSCADILTLAAREGVLALQGPTWPVYYGRRDSLSASLAAANQDIPSPNSTVEELVRSFDRKGLTEQDLVVLSGAHTIGQVQCAFYKDRLYNFLGTGRPDPSLDETLLAQLRERCPNVESSDRTLGPLDAQSPTKFDNAYYNGLRTGKGVLRSDQVLQSSGGVTQRFVEIYGSSHVKFFQDFGYAMVKMGNIDPLTGKSGEIRRSCRVVNSS